MRFPYPSLIEWQELWKAWDFVSLSMIPKPQLLHKPIDLRNQYIFYLGHIPTFLDIHLAQATGEVGVVSERYRHIFGRGVDPDVNEPRKCHRHSEIPEQWPDLDEILKFVSCIRTRVEDLYEFGGENLKQRSKKLRRALWMAFEHEAMHLETLLYMLLQAPPTRPLPGVVKPIWSIEESRPTPVGELCYNPWIDIPQRELSIGIDDSEDEDLVPYGWDNEKPRRTGIIVPRFQAKRAPICVGDYVNYLASKNEHQTHVPATWIPNINPPPTKDMTPQQRILNTFSLRTFFGPLPLANPYSRTLPVVASYDELAACASWLGGRIPTQEEVLSIYEYKAEQDTAKDTLRDKDPGTIGTENGRTNADGITKTPKLHKLFTKFGSETVVGFQEWMWSSVCGHKESLCGRGETGGAWEWTSTVLDRHDGFREQKEYPEYTGIFAVCSYIASELVRLTRSLDIGSGLF